MCFGPRTLYYLVSPGPNGVQLHHSASGVLVLVEVGAGRSPAKIFEMWHILNTVLPLQASLSLNVTSHPHFPFSIPPVHHAPSSLDFVFSMPSAREALPPALLEHCSICIMEVLVRGPPNTSSRMAPPFPACSLRGPVEGCSYTLTPWNKSEVTICKHLHIGLLSVLPCRGFASPGQCCNPVTQAVPNALHKHFLT